MTDSKLETWEASRDIAAELEQSVREMLAGQGAEVFIGRRQDRDRNCRMRPEVLSGLADIDSVT